MAKSFLNVISTDGREIRIAEFGFFADSPSFDNGGIIFRQGEKYKRIDLDSGALTDANEPPTSSHMSPDGRYEVRLNFTSPLTDGRGYCEMILSDKSGDDERVLVRFMGCENSIGKVPFSPDSKSIVFFGYPEDGNM